MTSSAETTGRTRPSPAAALATPQPAAGGGLDLGHQSSSRRIKDVVARVVMWLSFGIAVVPLLWILWTVASRGLTLLLTSSWWTQSQRNINSTDVGGGAVHAIQGTLLQAGMAALIAVPIGVFTAIYLVEYGRGPVHAIQGTLLQAGMAALIAVPIGVFTAIYLVEYGRGPVARLTSFMVDILTGVPSIVAALFVYSVWVTVLGFGRVGFAVSLALVLLMVPVVVRSTEEMLKLVPNELREASLALGVPQWKTITSIVLPTAFSGIITGVLLGLARIMGETAPLLILGPYTKSIATNLFSGNMPTLPTMINQDRTELGIAPAVERMWATALTLILLVLLLNLLGRVVARFGSVSR